jgi:hypothetical protein
MAVEEFQESQMDELLAFLAKWSPDHPELGEGAIVKWQKCFRYVFRYKGEMIGYIAQIPQVFHYGKKSGRDGTEPIGWGVTLVLDQSPDSERRRAASLHELLSRVEHNPPWQFGAVGVVPEIEEPYRRRGHVVRRDCSRMYARFMTPAKALKYAGKSSMYAPAIKLANVFMRCRRNADSGRVERVTRFLPEWDQTWARLLSEQHELYGARDAEFLNYKLTQPNRDYHVYTHAAGGYVIFRLAKHRTRDLSLVKVCDLVADEQARGDLLALATNFAYEVKAYGIVALGSADEESSYRKAGLFIARQYPVTMPPHITAGMRITFFESDLDNLW